MARLTARAVGAVALVVSVLGCGVSDSVFVRVNDVVHSLHVTHVDSSSIRVEELRLNVGDSARVAASPLNPLGLAIQGLTVTWTSLDAAIASVSGAGVIRGVSVGSTEIHAEAAGVTATIPTTVSDPSTTRQEVPVPSVIVISPPSLSLSVGESQTVTGQVRDQFNVVIPGATVAWSVEDGTVATVQASGLVTAVVPGETTIRASYQSLAASILVRVTAQAVAGAVFSDGFESGDFSGTVGGRWYNQVAATVSAAQPRTGDYSLEFFYAGKPSPDSDAWSEIRGSFEPNDASEIWMEWYVLVPSNYAYRGAGSDGGGNNKWWAFSFGGAAADKLHGGQCPTPGGWAVRTEFQGSSLGIDRARNTYVVSPLCGLNETAIQQHHSSRTTGDHGPFLDQPDPMIVAADRGTWVQFRVHLKLSSANVTILDPDTIGGAGFSSFPTALYQGDGVYEYWKNGTLVMQTLNLPLGEPGTAGVPINVFELMGWANTGFTQDTYFYIDDVKIYSSDPGW